MKTELVVAAIQYETLPGGIERNVEEHVRFIEDAADHGSRLAVFPELSLTSYDLEQFSAERHWLGPADERLAEIRAVCSELGVIAVVGAAVRDAGVPRLASVVIRPGSEDVIAPKSHLHDGERELFVAGEGPSTIEIDGWSVALAICFDAAVPSHAEEAAQAGADLYAGSVVYVEDEERRLDLHFGARAVDHRMFTLAANLGGSAAIGRSCGGSGVWGPDGQVMSRATGRGGEIVVARLFRSALDRYRG